MRESYNNTCRAHGRLLQGDTTGSVEARWIRLGSLWVFCHCGSVTIRDLKDFEIATASEPDIGLVRSSWPWTFRCSCCRKQLGSTGLKPGWCLNVMVLNKPSGTGTFGLRKYGRKPRGVADWLVLSQANTAGAAIQLSRVRFVSLYHFPASVHVRPEKIEIYLTVVWYAERFSGPPGSTTGSCTIPDPTIITVEFLQLQMKTWFRHEPGLGFGICCVDVESLLLHASPPSLMTHITSLGDWFKL